MYIVPARITSPTFLLGLLYAVTDQGKSCSDSGMADLDDYDECKTAAQTLEIITNDIAEEISSTTLPKACHYRDVSNLDGNVFWNTYASINRCSFCRSICRGKPFIIDFQ